MRPLVGRPTSYLCATLPCAFGQSCKLFTFGASRCVFNTYLARMYIQEFVRCVQYPVPLIRSASHHSHVVPICIRESIRYDKSRAPMSCSPNSIQIAHGSQTGGESCITTNKNFGSSLQRSASVNSNKRGAIYLAQ